MSRVVFFGTPEEALPTLRALDRSHDVGLVVTRPDRPRGRSGSPVAPPVKSWAMEHGLEVAQPEGPLEELMNDGYDVGVVVAYGRILSKPVLEWPSHGILNVHFSLLPRWRGAAPVARALMAGDTMTGVTIIRLDRGVDTGPVLTAQAVDIRPEDDVGALKGRLSVVGAQLLISVLGSYLDGGLVPVPQSDEGATLAARIGPEDRPLDADDDPAVFLGRVRGLSPAPGATLVIDGVVHKVLAAVVDGETPGAGAWVARGGWPVIGVGERGVRLVTLQAPGRRVQSGDAWLHGRQQRSGKVG
ncbi:MAG: methionyl-tRNA formyltransferase [Actinobacteria bacterium]|nr:methionyl-tRNA formyltransferase [Actinomycetota bacterium]